MAKLKNPKSRFAQKNPKIKRVNPATLPKRLVCLLKDKPIKKLAEPETSLGAKVSEAKVSEAEANEASPKVNETQVKQAKEARTKQRTINTRKAEDNIRYKAELTYKNLKIKWYQVENKLYLQCLMGTYFFTMPRTWKLESLDPKYLRLIEVIIFKPFWQPADLNNHLVKSSLREDPLGHTTTLAKLEVKPIAMNKPVLLCDKKFPVNSIAKANEIPVNSIAEENGILPVNSIAEANEILPVNSIAEANKILPVDISSLLTPISEVAATCPTSEVAESEKKDAVFVNSTGKPTSNEEVETSSPDAKQCNAATVGQAMLVNQGVEDVTEDNDIQPSYDDIDVIVQTHNQSCVRTYQSLRDLQVSVNPTVEMPDRWDLVPSVTSDDLVKDGDKNKSTPTRRSIQLDGNKMKKYKRVGIAFSGGNDSSACVPILPHDSILVYFKRVWDSYKNHLRHGQQLKCLAHIKKHWNRKAYVMETNIELISLFSTGRVGFSTDYMPCIPTILLADHFKIGYVCTGTIGLYLKGGYKAFDFLASDHYRFWHKIFQWADIPLFWPVGGCSDRVTESICYKANIPGQPCLRSDSGPCNKCFKCFRKNCLIQSDRLGEGVNSNAKPIAINREIQMKLAKKPITRIACKRLGWIQDTDIKAQHLKLDFSFENGYHPVITRKIVPAELIDGVIEGLNKWSRPMTDEEMQITAKLDLSSLVSLQSK